MRGLPFFPRAWAFRKSSCIFSISNVFNKERLLPARLSSIQPVLVDLILRLSWWLRALSWSFTASTLKLLVPTTKLFFVFFLLCTCGSPDKIWRHVHDQIQVIHDPSAIWHWTFFFSFCTHCYSQSHPLPPSSSRPQTSIQPTTATFSLSLGSF